jgi:hypothetical protein
LKKLDIVTAHELAHQPGAQHPDYDHAEGGIMDVDSTEENFSASSIARFRRASKWAD